MGFSRLGIFVLVTLTVFLTANCGYYNQIFSRKNLVDGSLAYKERKFAEAEELFRSAAARDPEGETVEGRTAQLFLARTLHSRFIGNRENKSFAEQAIAEYRKSIPQVLKELNERKAAYDQNPSGEDEQKKYLAALTAVNSTVSAIPSLYDNLQLPDQAREYQTQTANNADYPATSRVRALGSLAARFNTCANDITDTEQTKKTVKGPDGKEVFQFSAPENPADLNRLKECVAEGTKLMAQAAALEPDVVKNSKSLNIKSMTDEELQINNEILKPFESARSYKASLAIQAMRLAEMEGREADRVRLKAEADQARTQFAELGEGGKQLQAEIEARITVEEEAANANAANVNKK